MLSAVVSRVLRSYAASLSRGVSSVRSSSVSRPVVLWDDIEVDDTEVVCPSRTGCKGSKGPVSEKDIPGVRLLDEGAGGDRISAGAKPCSKSCAGCPRSAANSKHKGKFVERSSYASRVDEGEGRESGMAHSRRPALLEDSFVSGVSRIVDRGFHAR